MNRLMQLSIVAHSCLGGSEDYSDTSEYPEEERGKPIVEVFKTKEEEDVSEWNGAPSLPYPDHSYAKPPPIKSIKVSTPPTSADLMPSLDVQDSGLNPGVESWEGSVTRCICEFQHDDGYMICCDRCSVWQHVDCMGVDRQNIPDTYLCELCKPRAVDKHHAIRCQARKRELLMHRADSSDTDTEEDVKSRRMVMRRRKSRQSSHQSQTGYHRKPHETEKSRGQVFCFKGKNHKKRHGIKTANSYIPSPNARLPISPALTPVSMVMGQDFTSFRLLQPCRNTYTADLKRKLSELSSGTSLSLDRGVDMTMYSTTTDSFHEFSLVTVSMLQISADIKTQGLEANKDIKFEEPIIEYTGKVMLKEQCVFLGSMSHVLQFSIKGFPGIDISIDSSHHDNQAKFIRRSANPNARLRHFFDANNNLRFCIWSTTHILKGSEVTLPLEFENRHGATPTSFDPLLSDVSCPSSQKRRRRQSSRISESSALSDVVVDLGPALCSATRERENRKGQDEQQVVDITSLHDPQMSFQPKSPIKDNSSATSIRPNKIKVSKDRRRSETDRLLHPYGNSNQRKNSVSQSLESGINQSTNIGEKLKQQKKDDSKGDNVRSSNNGQDGKKLTREEKKLEAIMKAFERIDKKNERRNQRAEKRSNDPRSKIHKPLKLMPSRSTHKVSSMKSAYKKEHYHEKKGEKEQVHNSAIKNKIMQSLDVVGDNECNDDEAHDNGREQETSEIKNFINADDEEGSKHSAGCYECDNYECIDEKPLKDKKSKLDIAPKDIKTSDASLAKLNKTCKNMSPLKNQKRRSLRLNNEFCKTRRMDSKDTNLCQTSEVFRKIKKMPNKNSRRNVKKKFYEQDSHSFESNNESSKSDSSNEGNSDNDTKVRTNNDVGAKRQEVQRALSSDPPQINVSQVGTLQTDSNQGFTKKRWLRQAINESTESSQQHFGSEFVFATPLKKRRLTVDEEIMSSSPTSLTTSPPDLTLPFHHSHPLGSVTSNNSYGDEKLSVCKDVIKHDQVLQQAGDYHQSPLTNPLSKSSTSAWKSPADAISLQYSNPALSCYLSKVVPNAKDGTSDQKSPVYLESVSSLLIKPEQSNSAIVAAVTSLGNENFKEEAASYLEATSSFDEITSSPSLIRSSSMNVYSSVSCVESFSSSIALVTSPIITSTSSLSSSSSSSSLLSPISPCCLSPPSIDSVAKESNCKNASGIGKKKVSLSEYRSRMKTVPSFTSVPTTMTSIATSPVYSIITHTIPLLSQSVEPTRVQRHVIHSTSALTRNEIEKRADLQSVEDVTSFACVPNSKKSCEWDFEETAAEKILTKSLSLTDRLKFEFGLDAQEDAEAPSTPHMSSPCLVTTQSTSASSLPSPPTSHYVSLHGEAQLSSSHNHSSLVPSPPSSSSPHQPPRRIKHSESHRPEAFSSNQKERHRSHHQHQPPSNLAYRNLSRSQTFSRPASSFEEDGIGVRPRGGKGKYDANESSWSSNSPSRHHHHKRRYSSPMDRHGHHHREREIIDSRDRSHSRNDQKYLKYHHQNPVIFSRSRFQHH